LGYFGEPLQPFRGKQLLKKGKKNPICWDGKKAMGGRTSILGLGGGFSLAVVFRIRGDKFEKNTQIETLKALSRGKKLWKHALKREKATLQNLRGKGKKKTANYPRKSAN